jgi:hypothetical protein
MHRTMRIVLAAVLLGAIPATVSAAGEPNSVKVLFESRHLDQLNQGSEVTYRFERKVSDERLLGAALADDIKIGVDKVNSKGERDVVFKVFTGEHARDPWNLPELTVNPIFHWYLDRAVQNFGSLAGGDPQYLKFKFKEALRDKAEIEAIKFKSNGKDVDAYRVTVMPYANDPSSTKMQGFEGAKFTVVVSNEVPGYFVDLVSSYESKAAAGPKLEEHISFVSMGENK